MISHMFTKHENLCSHWTKFHNTSHYAGVKVSFFINDRGGIGYDEMKRKSIKNKIGEKANYEDL